jgi:hypothetical membrane protein
MIFSDSKTAGTLLLVGGAQFVIFLIIAEAVYPGYNVSHNVISDLGVWGKPSAPFFDISTMIFGLSVLASAYFINRIFKNRVFTVLFVLAGAGALGVGVFPENTFVIHGTPVLHTLSAATAFLVGGITAVSAFKITKPPFRFLSVAFGAAALTALVLFGLTRYSGGLGIGEGGMERMIVYPTILWMIAMGGYLSGSNN